MAELFGLVGYTFSTSTVLRELHFTVTFFRIQLHGRGCRHLNMADDVLLSYVAIWFQCSVRGQ